MILGAIRNKLKKSRKNKKTIHLAGWEVILNGDHKCYNFIATQLTSLQDLGQFYSGLKLVFIDNKLSQAFEFDELGKNGFLWKERALQPSEIGLNYREFKINKFLMLEESSNGFHQLGGTAPDKFTFPKCKCVVSFQYLGYIDNKDQNFNWLPFRLNLICPIYLNFDELYISYLKPNNPQIVNKSYIESCSSSFEKELSQKSVVEFQELKFNMVPEPKTWTYLRSGTPEWVQYPDIPTCPISGKRMKFLCQLGDGPRTKLKENVQIITESQNQYFDKMNFWGDGELFVFFEETSKTACYLIQNT